MVNDMCDYWKYYNKYTFPIQYSIYFPEYCIIYMMSYLIVVSFIKECSSQCSCTYQFQCSLIVKTAYEFPELPVDGLWLVPGVSAAHLSTPDTLSMSLCAARPFHHGSVAVACGSNSCSEHVTRPWPSPNFEGKENFKKALLSKMLHMTQMWWVHGLRTELQARVLKISLFHVCLCFQVSQALPQMHPSLAPVSTPHFVSMLSYTSPVTWHHTSWLLSLQPFSFDFIPALSRWGGHSMPFM